MDVADPVALELRRLPFGDAVVQRLVAEVQAEFTVLYGSPDETPLDAAMFDPPSGAFFVGRSGGHPVAIGGWRRRPDVTALGRQVAAEIKRMYVVPTARGRGFARSLLGHLEVTAREAGADLMVLETGLRQPEAIALYESAGYEPVPAYGFYACSPTSRYLGKRLDG